MARKKQKKSVQPDSLFLLKMLLYLILGMQWLWFVTESGAVRIALPVGPLLGLALASHERFKMDRKIEYTVLLVSGAVSLLLGVGIYFTV